MDRMDESTIDRLRQSAEEVFRGSPVLFVYVFGSVARGTARAGSDVDGAVFVDPAEPRDAADHSLALARRLSDASGVARVEVVILNDAPLPLRGRVVKERVVIYSRNEPVRVEFESLTLWEFFDFQIHARPLDERFLRDTAAGRR
jgi:predicted nucleotidyltransferase